MEENSGNTEEKKVVLLCVMRWVPVLSCDILQVQGCAGLGTWPCTEGLWGAALRVPCQCRWDTESAQRQGRIKQLQQGTVVSWETKEGDSAQEEENTFVLLPLLIMFPAFGQWRVMEITQIGSLVHVLVWDSSTSEKDIKTVHSTTVHLPPLSGAAVIVCAVPQGFSCFLGLWDDLWHWVLWVWLGPLLVFPVEKHKLLYILYLPETASISEIFLFNNQIIAFYISDAQISQAYVVSYGEISYCNCHKLRGLLLLQVEAALGKLFLLCEKP